MKSVGVPLQDVKGSSAVVISPTDNGRVHLVKALNLKKPQHAKAKNEYSRFT